MSFSLASPPSPTVAVQTPITLTVTQSGGTSELIFVKADQPALYVPAFALPGSGSVSFGVTPVRGPAITVTIETASGTAVAGSPVTIAVTGSPNYAIAPTLGPMPTNAGGTTQTKAQYDAMAGPTYPTGIAYQPYN